MFRKRLNINASDTNTLQLMQTESGCCGEALPICKYRVVVDPFVDLASITVEIDSEEVNIPFPAPVDDLADLPAAIATALESVGYIMDDEPKRDPKNVVIATDGTERTIDIWGEAVIINLISSAPVTDTATTLCAKSIRCAYSVVVPLGVIDLVVDGGASEELNSGDPYATGSAATLKADIEGSTYLENAEQVTVTENVADEEFTITFYFAKAEVKIGGVMATRSGCKADFVA